MRITLRRATRAAVATLAAAALVLLSVPFAANAATGDSYINVKVGGARVAPGGVSDVAGLDGVKLQLYYNSADGEYEGTAVPGAAGQCTTTGGGLCTFTVPDTDDDGANEGDRFWVKELSANNSNNAILNLTTGTTSGFDSTPYIWRTPRLYESTVTLPAGAEMPEDYNPPGQGNSIPTAGRWVSTGIFPASLKNPRYQAVCNVPVRIGILFDLSTSMEGDGIIGAHAAGHAMVDALVGSGAYLGLYNFGTDAPKDDESNFAPVQVTAGAVATSLKNQITGYTANGDINYTNWDRGFWQLVSPADQNLDIVIVLTDGNPTVYGDPATAGTSTTRFSQTEQAIFSANAVKASGTQILTFGVGDGVSGPGDNLAAVSGPIKWSAGIGITTADYAQTNNWDLVKTQLAEAADALTCQAPIKVHKQERLLNGTLVDGDDWPFTATRPQGNPGTISAPTPAGGQTNDDGDISWTVTFNAAGQSTPVTIAETLPDSSWSVESVTCKDNNGPPLPVTLGTSFTLPSVGIGSNIVCEVINKKLQNSVKVDKAWMINGIGYTNATLPSQLAPLAAQLQLQNTANTNMSAQGWGVSRDGYTVPTSVNIAETISGLPALCTWDSAVINGPGLVNANVKNVTANTGTLNGGLSSYTITNTLTCMSELTLVKSVLNPNGGTAVAADWDLKFAGPSNGTVKSGTKSTVTPGAFTITELNGPSGYTQTNFTCSVANNGAQITILLATSVTCTFTNTDSPATLTLQKAVVGAPGVQPTSWTLTAKEGTTLKVTGNGTATGPVTANTPITLTESAIAPINQNDFTPSAWVCTTGTQAPVSYPNGIITPGLPTGSSTVCVITNTAKAADPTITKTATSVTPNANGTWTINYDVVVTNTSKFASISYTLHDALAFGTGITPVATATGPGGGTIVGWNGLVTTLLGNNVSLGALASHTYKVTATATLAAGIAPASLVCPGPTGNGGFMNRAEMVVAGTTYQAQDCKQPVIPTFSKVNAGSPVQNPDGTWTLTYTLKVVNPSATQSVFYDLSDTPVFPAGVTVESKTANGIAFTSVIATGKSLAANTTDTYTIVIVVSIPASVKAAQLACGPETGFLNKATATSSGQTLPGQDCQSVTPPVISFDKKVESATQNSTGTWTIVYSIKVKNDGTVAGRYSLEDELKLAVPGVITVLGTPTATGPSGPIGTFPASAVLANNVLLGTPGMHTYTVTAEVSLAAGVFGDPTADPVVPPNPKAFCDVDGGTNGFLNDAKLTVAGVDTTDSACASPSVPEISKQLSTSIETGPGVWTVTYLVTVDNDKAGAKDNFYKITDVLSFPNGVTLGAPVVTNTADPNVPIDWNNGAFVPTAKAILAGATHTYKIVVVATVPAGTANLKCTGEPNHGFFNGVTLFVGADAFDTEACGDITESLVPSIVKKIVTGYPQQKANGDWVIQYDVTVTSPSATRATTYSLDDNLDFGLGMLISESKLDSWPASVTPVAWNGTGDVANNVNLPGGAVHVYTFEATVNVPEDVYDDDGEVCKPGMPNALKGGFLNTAILTSGNATPVQVQACDQPAQPVFEKILDPNAQLEYVNGAWKVGYLLTVTNPSGLKLNYDLTDTLGFPDGVTISGAAISSPDVTVSQFWTGIGVEGSKVVTGQELLPNQTHDAKHTFKVTATATLTGDFDLEDAECSDPEKPGSGLFNGALLTAGGIADPDEACDDIPVAELTLVKQVDNTKFPEDLDGHTLAKDTDWTLTAAGPNGTIVSGITGTDQVTTVLVPAGDYALTEQPIANPSSDQMAYYTAGDWSCLDGEILELEIGDKVTCTIKNTGSPVDLKIVKSDDDAIIDEGDSYEYTFTVENKGTIAAEEVVVTDVIPPTLKVDMDAIVMPAGWEKHITDRGPNDFGGILTFEKIGSFAAGGSAQFVIPVTSAADLPREDDDPTGKILDLVNTATVGSSGVELTPTNNTSTETTPVKSLAIEITGTCSLNAPYATWSITPYNTDSGDTVSIIWWTPAAYAARNPNIPAGDVAAILANGALQVDVLPAPPGGWSSGDEQSGTQLWAGASVNAVTKVGTGWPGYKLVNGQWVLDPTNKFYPIRNSAVVEVRMNPSTGATVGYPPASIKCSAFPPFEFPTLALTGAAGVATLVVGGGAFLLFGVIFVAASRRKMGRHSV